MYDGSGLIEVLRGHEYLSHPFAVTMYGGEVYWTDWRTNTLAKANKWTGHNVTVVQRTNTQPFDLQVYHPSRQPQGGFATVSPLLPPPPPPLPPAGLVGPWTQWAEQECSFPKCSFTAPLPPETSDLSEP